MKKTLILMSLALLFSACSFDKKTEEMPKEIKIGLVAPLSGEEAKYWRDAVNAVQMIFEKANSLNGGLSPNLVLVTEDSACESDTASRAAEKLIKTEHVPVILTAGKCAAETLGVGKVAQAEDVTVIAGLSSAPEIAALGDHVFQLYRDTDGARTLATELTTMNAKNIALVSVDNAYGKVSAETLKKLFTAKPILEETIKPEEKDFAWIAKKIKAQANIDALVLFIDASTSEALLEALNTEGLLTSLKGKILGNEGLLSDAVMKKMGKNVDGIHVSNIQKLTLSGASANFVKQFQEKYKIESDESSLALIGEATKLLVDAINKVGFKGDAATALHDITESSPRGGTLGEYWFDGTNGHIFPFVLRVAKDGVLQ